MTHMQRILIYGVTGSGKSTLAALVAEVNASPPIPRQVVD